MHFTHQHPWDPRPEEAVQIQQQLRTHVRVEPVNPAPQRVGGVDVSFPRGRRVARAAAVVLDSEGMQMLDQATAEIPLAFPYIPGLLSFREIPAILAALEALAVWPDILLCDGHGLAHPRRFGLACHLGVLLDLPSIGCAKSILVGAHPPLQGLRGSQAPLAIGDEVVGLALRTRTGVRPVYISVGHHVDLPSARDLVLSWGRGYRLPEPTRLADKLA